MVSVRVKVCDVCEEVGRETKNYRITGEGRAASIDLCTRHAAPLEAFLLKVNSRDGSGGDDAGEPARVAPAKAPAKAAKAPSKRPRIQVTSMEEIEAAKKQPPKK